MPVAVVTGANKGIGLAIVHRLIQEYPRSALCRRHAQAPLLVYLTARNRERGEQAAKDVRASALMASTECGGLARVEFRQLDVTDDESVRAFRDGIAAAHEGGVDVLVNNAGVSLEGDDADTAAQTLETNYHGPLRLTRALLPTLMPPHARIATLTSMLGKLNKYPPDLTAAFRAAATYAHIPSTSTSTTSSSSSTNPPPSDDTTPPDPTTPATTLTETYLAALRTSPSTAAAQGWPSSPYAISKAALTAATLALAAAERAARPADARCINACCPGYVKTDMTKGRGRKSVQQGAETPVVLALGDIAGVTGEFWERGEVSAW